MATTENDKFCELLNSIRKKYGADIAFEPKRLKNILSDLNINYKNEETKFMFLINEHQTFIKSISKQDKVTEQAIFDKIEALCGFNELWTKNVARALFAIIGKSFDAESNIWINEKTSKIAVTEKKRADETKIQTNIDSFLQIEIDEDADAKPVVDSSSNRLKKTINYDDGTIYEGEVLNGKPDGYGKMMFSNGNIYEGFFLNGKRGGKGRFTWSSGAFYEGVWVQDLREDEHGHQLFSDGSVYDGGWKAGKRDGYGAQEWKDGRMYVGEWKDDKRNGQGIMSFPDKATYDGEWVDDEYCGYGIYTRKDGFKYVGEWGIDSGGGYGIYVMLEDEFKKTWVYDGPQGVHHPIKFGL